MRRRVKTAFVTGASGFIGRHLTARLVPLTGEVVALARGTATPAIEELRGAKVVYGDVTVSSDVDSALSGVDAVFRRRGDLLRLGRGRDLCAVTGA